MILLVLQKKIKGLVPFDKYECWLHSFWELFILVDNSLVITLFLIYSIFLSYVVFDR
jgi:hypothetical protein